MRVNDFKQRRKKEMTLMVQKGFWQDAVIGKVRHKMEELYLYHSEVLKTEKSSILAYWSEFEHLHDVLGESWKDFEHWFLRSATSPETITRCRRAMREDGTINNEKEN
jgi:hypothetical protein